MKDKHTMDTKLLALHVETMLVNHVICVTINKNIIRMLIPS